MWGRVRMSDCCLQGIEVEGIQGAGSQIGFCGAVSPKSPEFIN